MNWYVFYGTLKAYYPHLGFPMSFDSACKVAQYLTNKGFLSVHITTNPNYQPR
jgi:hypothetical protein